MIGNRLKMHLSSVKLRVTKFLLVLSSAAFIFFSLTSVARADEKEAAAFINDLVAYPGPSDKEVIINFTAVGDNYEYGKVSSYIVKYYNEPINSSNWDLASTYSQSFIPLESGLLESRSLFMTSYDSYWFALKATDDNGLNSSISNSDDSISPLHNITVDSMSCVNGKNGYRCNDTTNETTNYYYDVLNFSANIENKGNINETKNVTAGIYLNPLWISSITNENMLFEKNKNTSIGLMQVNITNVQELQQNYKFRLDIEDSYSQHSMETDEYPFWSIKEHSDIIWYYGDQSPIPSFVGNETEYNDFRVAFKMMNNNTYVYYYDYPFEININNITNGVDSPLDFSISSVRTCSSCHCDIDNKKCYYDIPLNHPSYSDYFFWWVTGLPAGSYNVSIKISTHNNDMPQIVSRNVIVQ